jgi:hypothetical protein
MHKRHVVVLTVVLLGIAAWSLQSAAAEKLEITLVKPTGPVRPGEQVTLAVKTAVGAECKGQVRYRTFTSVLPAKTTNDEGLASWTWRVSSEARGSYPVEVTCTQGDKQGFLSAQLVVN